MAFIAHHTGLVPQVLTGAKAHCASTEGARAGCASTKSACCLKLAVTVHEQNAQVVRVKEQAEQKLRVSMAFTEAEATGRSTQMNLPT